MRSRFLVLVAAPMVVLACSAAPEPGGSAPQPAVLASAASVSAAVGPAKHFVEVNAQADATWNLVARKFFNNDTEVVSFYEPTPGNVIAVGAGRPTGVAMLKRSSDPAALWGDEAMPQTLVEALARKAAGVGQEQYSTSNAVDAPESLASSVIPDNVVLAPETGAVSPFVVGTGYCDTQWKIDFPSNMSGPQTSYCRVTDPVHFPPKASNGSVPQFIAAWNSSSNGAIPYNSGAGCSCSCRTPQGFLELHANPASVSNTNEWENFASVCPALGNATVTVTVSGSKNTFTVFEDNYWWSENFGTVSCFFTTCTKTHDISSWSMSATSQLNGGLVNLISDAYGP